MSSRSMNRKDFLVLSISVVSTSALVACGEDDPAPGGGTAGTGGSGTAGSGTAGTAGSGTGGSGTAGTGTGGTAAGSGGTSSTAGSGGTGGTTSGGMGGGGSGGTTAGSGGSGGGTAGGGSGGGGGGGMCGKIMSITHVENTHDHIPDDMGARMTFLMNLASHINGNMATMEFTLPSEGQTPHTHKIIFTAQDIMTLKSGAELTKGSQAEASAGDPHPHTYKIRCMA